MGRKKFSAKPVLAIQTTFHRLTVTVVDAINFLRADQYKKVQIRITNEVEGVEKEANAVARSLEEPGETFIINYSEFVLNISRRSKS